MKKMKWMLLFTCLAFVLFGCSKKEEVKIGAQPFSEQQIQASMIQQLIEENTDLDAEIVPGLSSTAVAHQAMKKDDVQITIRYVGTDLSGTLKMTDIPKDPEKAMKLVQDRFKKDFDQTWFPSWGFDNKYAFTVRKDVAEELGLDKISDLEKYAKDMTLGTDTIWLEREFDGYPVFKKLYGFEFGKTTSMDVGLLYKAVDSKNIDVGLTYSTDANIEKFGLKALEDDKKLFPPYQVSNVVRDDLIKEYPEIKEKVLDKLVDFIDEDTMTKLNYKVDIEKKEPEDVAKEFLIEKGLIKE